MPKGGMMKTVDATTTLKNTDYEFAIPPPPAVAELVG